MAKHKYHAKATTVDGINFDSKRESRRYGELQLLERAGLIRNLTLQPSFELLPKMPGQRAIIYVADFAYEELVPSRYEEDSWVRIVEDSKGFRTRVFRMKEKMFHAKYPGIVLRLT